MANDLRMPRRVRHPCQSCKKIIISRYMCCRKCRRRLRKAFGWKRKQMG